jgi:hypothetical protein
LPLGYAVWSLLAAALFMYQPVSSAPRSIGLK